MKQLLTLNSATTNNKAEGNWVVVGTLTPVNEELNKNTSKLDLIQYYQMLMEVYFYGKKHVTYSVITKE